MNTLILAQDDSKTTKALKEPPVQLPTGTLAVERLNMYPDGSPAAVAALGVPDATLGVSNSDRIKSKIIRFAAKILKEDAEDPPAKQHDVVEFQIVFVFHQTSAHVAKAITKALWSVPGDAQWLQLPYTYRRARKVSKVWLVSCESGADRVAADPRLLPYIEQSLQMRCAAGMLVTEKTPPPSSPREFWHPKVYTFSTGDVVHGALTLNPNNVGFRTAPNWEIDPQGNINQIQGSPVPDVENPSAGTIHIYDGLDHSGTFPVSAGIGVNILSPVAP